MLRQTLLVPFLAVSVLINPAAPQPRGPQPRGPQEASPQKRDTEAALESFAALHKKEQAKVLSALREAVKTVDGPYLQSIRSLCKKALQSPPKGKEKRQKAMSRKANWKERVGGDHPLTEGLGFAVHNQYLFGQGKIAVVEASASRHRKGKKKRNKKRRSKKRRLKFPLASDPTEQLEAMLRGYLPETDLALSQLLRELDTDRSADRFSVFLDSWRNGNESFYRALDRTAGTKEGLFFYDAMLSDYIRLLVPKKHPDFKKIRRSSKVAHDSLHQSFLAYRQYRGIRECMALAMLIPPDVKLPPAIARYEDRQHQDYSFRDQVMLLLRLYNQDMSKVVDLLVKTAEPLPEHLWTKSYDPFPRFNKAFDDLLPEMLKIANNSDKVLAEEIALRKAMHKRVADVAWGAFHRVMRVIDKE